jgi:hypothetical protein
MLMPKDETSYDTVFGKMAVENWAAQLRSSNPAAKKPP